MWYVVLLVVAGGVLFVFNGMTNGALVQWVRRAVATLGDRVRKGGPVGAFHASADRHQAAARRGREAVVRAGTEEGALAERVRLDEGELARASAALRAATDPAEVRDLGALIVKIDERLERNKASLEAVRSAAAAGLEATREARDHAERLRDEAAQADVTIRVTEVRTEIAGLNSGLTDDGRDLKEARDQVARAGHAADAAERVNQQLQTAEQRQAARDAERRRQEAIDRIRGGPGPK